MKKLAHIILLTFVCQTVYSQTYYNVSHFSGTKAVGGIDVTVARIGTPDSFVYCGASPYWIGHSGTSGVTNSGYAYSFSKPVNAARFQFTASNPGEVISFVLNGNYYVLDTSNISDYIGTCGVNYGRAISGGALTFTSVADINTQVTIEGDVSFISVQDVDSSNGTIFNFHFLLDTTVAIQNVTDSVLCSGDTMYVNYTTKGSFLPGNIFRFQLSDKNGSFASSTTIGSVTGTGAGKTNLTIPVLPSGDNYKLRVISTSPVDTSKPLNVSIAIGNPPQLAVYNNGPGCAGDTITLGMFTGIGSHVTNYVWNGPGLLPNFLMQYVTLSDVKVSDGGMYYAMAEDYGCKTIDSTFLQVFANPVVTISSSNSPVCEGDTLRMIGFVDSVNALNMWQSETGIKMYGKDLILPNVQLADSGRYVLYTKLNGCTAKDSTYVIVHPSPVPHANLPAAVCAGEPLMLQSNYSSSTASYMWTGPGGFVSTAADTGIAQTKTYHTGRYIITITDNGCTATEVYNVKVKDMPPVPEAISNSPVCIGDTVYLNTGNTIINASYNWDGPNGYHGNNAASRLYNTSIGQSGLYVVTANLDGCYTADTLQVNIKPLPEIPQISSNSPLLFGKDLHLQIRNPQQGASYSWTGPNDFATLVFNPEILYATKLNAGIYTVKATLNGCSVTDKIEVDVQQLIDTGMVVLYPNANDGDFTISVLLLKDEVIPVRITNGMGQLVYSNSFLSENKRLTQHINLKGRIASGAYKLHLLINGKVKIVSFIVDRQ